MTVDPGPPPAEPGSLRPVARAVVFDFDGTLADSFPLASRILPRLARELRFRDPGPDGLERLRELPLGRILSELGIAWWKVPLVVWRARSLLAAEREPLPLFPGMADLLRELDRAGVEWGILTTNSLAVVRRALHGAGAPEPGWLDSGVGLSGKAGRLRTMAQSLGVAPEDLLVVADETRDVEAARSAGAPMVAVAWGYSSPGSLVQAGAERIVLDVQGLRSLLLGEPVSSSRGAGL